jgi:hypothetical protein
MLDAHQPLAIDSNECFLRNCERLTNIIPNELTLNKFQGAYPIHKSFRIQTYLHTQLDRCIEV